MPLSPIYPADCVPSVPYACDPCPAIEHGRVRAVALLKKGYHFTDPTSTTEWQTGIANGDILLIPYTQGNYDGGTAKKVEGYGDVKEKVIGYDYKLMWKDENFINNKAFYDALDDSSSFALAFFTETLVWLTNASVIVDVNDKVDSDPESQVVWEGNVSWFHRNKPSKYTKPANVIDCFTLVD
jgi:hypothetical protein